MSSVFRIYPSKSNTIASGNFAAYNSGQNSVSELWYGGGGAGAKKNSISRFLMHFDLDELQRKIKSKDININNITSIKLRMKNAIPRDKVLCPEKGNVILKKAIAASYDLICFPINKSWDEGRGYDMLKEDFNVKQVGNPLITGYSNWNSATYLENWDAPGVYSNPEVDAVILKYSGTTTFKGLELIKSSTTQETVYQFNIFSSTTLSTSLSANTVGNNTDIYFNPNSGVTSALTSVNTSVINSFEGITNIPANTPVTVNHNLGTSSVFAQIIENDELIIFPEISGYTNNSFVFESNVALTNAKFLVFGGQSSGTTNIDQYSVITGITSGTPLTVNHNLGTDSVQVTLEDTDTNEVVYALVSGYTSNSVEINSNANVPNLKINVFGGTGTTTGNTVSFHSEIISLVANTDYIINHNLGTSNLSVETIDNSTSEKVFSEIKDFTNTTVTLVSNVNVEELRVNVMGKGMGFKVGTYQPTTFEISNLLSSDTGFDDLGIQIGTGTTEEVMANDSFNLSATTEISGTSITKFCTSQHFPIGDEDLNVSIEGLVRSWLSGETENNGVGVAYKRDYELNSGDTRFVSSFFTDKTNTAWKPFIEVSYDQAIKDDRKNVTNNRSNKLFLYTFSGHNFANYYSAGTVDIKTSAGANYLTGLTPTQLQKGIYYVDVDMSGAKRGQTYKDVWNDITFVPGVDKQTIIQTFQIQDNFYTNPMRAPQVNDYSLSTYGIDNNAIISNEETLKVFVDLRVNYSTKSPSTAYDIQYRMIMNNQEVVIPWTSVSQAVINKQATNFFTLETDWLLHNQQYQIQFKINEFGTSRIVTGEEINFRVMREF